MKWIAFLSPLFAYSLYLGNPGGPGLPDSGLFSTPSSWIAGKVGYLGDLVMNQGLKTVDGSHQKFTNCEYTTNQGVLTLSALQRFSLYGSMGAMRWVGSQIAAPERGNRYETSGHFCWGIGGQLIAAQRDKLCLGFDLKYQSTSPHFNLLSLNGTPLAQHARLIWREWQVGAALSYHTDIFYPYIGLRYSNVLARFKNLPSRFIEGRKHFKARNTDKFGLSIGTTLSTGSIFSLTLEARMIDQTALSLAFDFKF